MTGKFREEVSNEDIFLYDWITFTTVEMNYSQVIQFLGMSHIDFQGFPGRYGYKTRWSFGGIHVLMDGYDDSMGICVEMSGQGCRDWETFSDDPNYLALFYADTTGLIKLTRVDVAFDDHTGRVPMKEVLHLTLNKLHRSIWRSYKVEISNEGTSCMYGSKQSEIYCRIYDKAAERGFGSDLHWVRIETVFKRDRAHELAQIILKDAGMSEKTYFGILSHYLAFCTPTDDTNTARWPLVPWWEQLVNGSEKISLVKTPGEVYNLSEKEHNLFRQYGNSMLTVILCRGLDHFLEKLLSGDNWLRKKYVEICRMNGSTDTEVSMQRVREIQQKLDWIRTEVLMHGMQVQEEDVDY